MEKDSVSTNHTTALEPLENFSLEESNSQREILWLLKTIMRQTNN